MWAAGLGLVVLIATGFALRDWIREEYWLWRFFERLGRNAQGYPEYRHRATGIVFVSLPGGKFWMGAQSEDPNGPNYDPLARQNEGPIHKVALSPFLIAKYEVTQEQWKALMRTREGLWGNVMKTNPSRFQGEDLPVEQVWWEDCREFCRRAGLRLPTEAQWEYACRGGRTEPYAGTEVFEDMGWHIGNSDNKTHPVGGKQPNGFGLHDMHGNVEEWCEDVYDSEFYSRPEAASPDPLSTSGSEFRVGRGGCWHLHAWFCRSPLRFGISPDMRFISLGFRPAWPLP